MQSADEAQRRAGLESGADAPKESASEAVKRATRNLEQEEEAHREAAPEVSVARKLEQGDSNLQYEEEEKASGRQERACKLETIVEMDAEGADEAASTPPVADLAPIRLVAAEASQPAPAPATGQPRTSGSSASEPAPNSRPEQARAGGKMVHKLAEFIMARARSLVGRPSLGVGACRAHRNRAHSQPRRGSPAESGASDAAPCERAELEPEPAAQARRKVSQHKDTSRHLEKLAQTASEVVRRAHQDAARSSAAANPDKDVDGGYAWVILAIMFIINASMLGTARAYGLIFEKLARQGTTTRAHAAYPFTIMGAVENMAGPLAGLFLSYTGSWRVTIFVGSCLLASGHLLMAFCGESLSLQLLTMGLMCGLGLSCVTISSFQINNAYFVRYRSRAFGFCLTGAVFATLYISPMCNHVLTNYSVSACYCMLALLLLPNVLLSLLLKPKVAGASATAAASAAAALASTAKPTNATNSAHTNAAKPSNRWSIIIDLAPPDARQHQLVKQVECIAGDVAQSRMKLVMFAKNNPRRRQRPNNVVWSNCRKVLGNPYFHLIWPTQLLFCWLNFVFGMIIVDLGKDRGLDYDTACRLISIWALGQLVGRLGLGSLTDLRLIGTKYLTVTCFACIGASTWAMNVVRLQDPTYNAAFLSLMVFIQSAFIANLYILFNGLVLKYCDKKTSALSIGISSFIGSFFLLPRADIIGYYRDSTGNYDSMLTMFTCISMFAALVWLLIAPICAHIQEHKSNKRRSFYLEPYFSV